MELDNLIENSYGYADGIFAGHELNRQSSLKSLISANEVEIGYQEFLDRHRNYLNGRGFPEEHINNQLLRVSNLSIYFRLD